MILHSGVIRTLAGAPVATDLPHATGEGRGSPPLALSTPQA